MAINNKKIHTQLSLLPPSRYAFSKNNRPTMVPIPDSNVSFGRASQMSNNDIVRINNLYKCCESPVALPFQWTVSDITWRHNTHAPSSCPSSQMFLSISISQEWSFISGLSSSPEQHINWTLRHCGCNNNNKPTTVSRTSVCLFQYCRGHMQASASSLTHGKFVQMTWGKKSQKYHVI